jgi:OOP family OmpA-OmpF porin
MGNDLTQAQFLIGLTWTRNSTPRDGDADGVIDRRDACPDSLPGEQVDRRGCPLIPRPADPEAPGVPGAIPMPMASDTDADGVPDLRDRCPLTVRGSAVDENGCALDADGDGVHDGLGMDKCPDTPRGALVDVHGCPLDSDGDGVYDGLDKCPDTPAGAQVDEAGCPAI